MPLLGNPPVFTYEDTTRKLLGAKDSDGEDRHFLFRGDTAGAGVQWYMAVLGDSQPHNAIYSSGAGSTTPLGNWFADGSTDNYWRSWGWPSWVGPMSMQRIQVVKSWARQTNGILTPGTNPAGYPLSLQITTMLADPIYSKVNVVALMVPTNDTAYSLSVWAQELRKQLARISKLVLLIAAPPRNDSVATTDGGDGLRGWAWLLQARKIARQIADESNGRIKWVDGYTKNNTPGTTPDVAPAGTLLAADNIHTSNVGAYNISDAVVAALGQISTTTDIDVWPHNSSAADTVGTSPSYRLDQGIVNPLMLSAGGTVPAGTAYGNQTIAAVGAPTSVTGATGTASPLGFGNLQQVTTVALASGDGFSALTASFHNAGGTFLSAGDAAWVQAYVVLKAGGIYPRTMELRLAGFQNPTNYIYACFALNATNEYALPLSGDRAFLLRTPTFYAPVGINLSNLQGRLLVYYAGAGTSVVQYGHFECRRFRSGTY